MRQPWREPVASIVAHRALFSCGAKGIGDALRCPLVIGRKGDADMAVVEDGVVLAIGLLDLIEALRDQEGAHAIACEKGEARLEEIQSAERWKLVKRSEEHTSELQSLMRISYAVFCLKKKNNHKNIQSN